MGTPKTNDKPSAGKPVDGPKGTDVAKAAGSAVVPDFMKGDVGKGTENLGTGDYEMPRLKLLQGISEELQAFDGLKAGEFFHTLLEKSFGSVLKMTPLYISKRYILWKPRHDGGGILARSDDAIHWNPSQGEFEVKVYKDRDTRVKWKLAPTVAESGLANWGTYDPSDPKSQPAATEVFVYVVDLPDLPEASPVALMLQRTALGPAKKLNGKLNVSTVPIFGRVFEMSSFIDDRGGQKFNNYRFTAAGLVEDQERYGSNKAFHEQFKKEGVKINDKDGDESGTVPNDTTNSEAGKTETKY